MADPTGAAKETMGFLVDEFPALSNSAGRSSATIRGRHGWRWRRRWKRSPRSARPRTPMPGPKCRKSYGRSSFDEAAARTFSRRLGSRETARSVTHHGL